MGSEEDDRLEAALKRARKSLDGYDKRHPSGLRRLEEAAAELERHAAGKPRPKLRLIRGGRED